MKIHLHRDSHISHVRPRVRGSALALVEALIEEGDASLRVDTVKIRERTPCSLVRRSALAAHEPVFMAYRGVRRGSTPCVIRGPEIVNVVTVVSGPSPDADGTRVLYTVYGGPPTPREPWDPSLACDDAKRAEAAAFWDEHAICVGVGDGYDVGGDEEDVIANATPHAIQVGERTFEPSGILARVDSWDEPMERSVNGIPIVKRYFGNAEGLPPVALGVLWIVSGMVLDATHDRSDLAAPGELVRDSAGRVVGCLNLRWT